MLHHVVGAGRVPQLLIGGIQLGPEVRQLLEPRGDVLSSIKILPPRHGHFGFRPLPLGTDLE